MDSDKQGIRSQAENASPHSLEALPTRQLGILISLSAIPMTSRSDQVPRVAVIQVAQSLFRRTIPGQSVHNKVAGLNDTGQHSSQALD